MKPIALFSSMALLGLSCSALAAPDAASCAKLAGLSLAQLHITEARWVQSESPTSLQTTKPLPAHCLVRGELQAREGVPAAGGPAHYGIHFELRMPLQWARRLYYEGGGGSNGVVAEAVGHVPSLKNGPGYVPALYRGFAVVTSDSGHSAAQNPGFGTDPQARVDYGYASIGKVTAVARSLIKAFYTQDPRWSYFAGCSKGGQEALQAMQRYGNLFDGIVAGAPGYRLPRAALAEAWDSQTLAALAPKDANGQAQLDKAFSDNDLALVANAVIKQCAGDDGTADSLIVAPQRCSFDPASLQCTGGNASACLSGAQVEGLKRIFAGPKDAAGKPLYNHWLYDSGIASAGWRAWKLGSAGKPALNLTLGGGSLNHVFMTPPPAQFDILTAPMASIASGIAARTAQYPQSALDFMEAASTELSAFHARKGKLILYHGVSDPVFSAQDTIDYYQRLQQRYGAGTHDFARLFLVPGMNHCGGGDYALDTFDTLDPIIDWVEHQKAPKSLTASAGPSAGQHLKPGLTRPLCPFPSAAQYRGQGDPDQASSFDCR
ncbi:MAG: tannase/feruloyl esterase family alpha/beta hydrolase [Pseudomonas sp.]|nr:tannase/feruloyl esterase family alpha/beta hydrolase [Pseudomonas sp.]